MPESIAIVSVGMTTSVGLTAAETLASVRSGVARFSETTWFDSELEPITAGMIPAVTPPEGLRGLPLFSPRERRVQALLAAAVKNCVKGLAAHLSHPPLYLARPEALLHRQGQRAFDASLIDAVALTPGVSEIVWAGAGRAAGLLALRPAAERLRSSATPFVLAGGADSYCDRDVLRALDAEGRLKSARNLDGFIPGEGAAVLLLATVEVARLAALPVVATLVPPVEGFESGHLASDVPYRGDGLASTVRALFDLHGTSHQVTDVFSSMNGESHWGKEWGVTFIRNRALFADDFALHHPADSYGDTGAASGPLLVGLAALESRAARAHRHSLVYASSDRGARAALLIEPA